LRFTVNNIVMPFYEDEREFIPRELRKRGIKPSSYKIARVSVDARKAPNVMFVYTVICEADDVNEKAPGYAGVFSYNNYPSDIPEKDISSKISRPVVVGFGPCGMFCAYLLALKGFRPIVIERGSCGEKRFEKTENYFKGGELDTETNVQFGEGGAGMFSDGKLMTRISDDRCSFVMETFVKFGAPEEIMYLARPHVGTDKLRGVVKAMREKIISLGGEILFDTPLVGITCLKDGTYSLKTSKGEFNSDGVFLAVGHSAHDTVRMLKNFGLNVTAKDFSVGMRIEHPRRDVEYSVYKKAVEHKCAHKLPAAEYNVSYRKGDNKGDYSFCMCPGGVVVPSESERETIVTNGMSYHARDGVNSNCAIAVSVNSSDHGGDPERALRLKCDIERNAYILGKGKAPCQTVGSYISGTRPKISFGKVAPTYERGVMPSDISKLFTSEQNKLLKDGLSHFMKVYPFFKNLDACLTAPETRTSSPVRMNRTKELTALTYEGSELKGLYPCGEGAGYAGGITSAAIDGLRAAEAYIYNKKPKI